MNKKLETLLFTGLIISNTIFAGYNYYKMNDFKEKIYSINKEILYRKD